MGKSNSKQKINRNPEYYTVKGQNTNAVNQNDNPSQMIELFFFLRNVEQGDHKLEIYHKLENVSSTVGITNTVNGENIEFSNSFALSYFFEKEQHLTVKIFSNHSQDAIDFTVGRLMGSKGQRLILPIPSKNNSASLVVQAQNYSKSAYDAEIKIKGNFNRKNVEPYFLVKRTISSDNSMQHSIYKSEVLQHKKDNNYEFQAVNFPSTSLNESDFQKPLIIEFIDANKGTILGHSNLLFDKSQLLSTSNLIVKDEKTNKEVMDLHVSASVKLSKQYNFVDYLRGGVQISLVIGIDFTLSNKKIDEPGSLHNIGSFPNCYEKAISSCGGIVSYYDYDQSFPVFGFGAILPQNKEPSHCFNLNFQQDPEIVSIQGVLDTYRQNLPLIQLYGPTNFSPLLQRTLQIVSSKPNDIYHVLMILTDGQITDIDDTTDSVVELSFLPVSIIIIGVGYGPFGSMERLDGDTTPLISSKGVRAKRDIVQFVEFQKFQNEGCRLASEVLEEIPSQIEGYYKMMNKIPGDAIMLNI